MKSYFIIVVFVSLSLMASAQKYVDANHNGRMDVYENSKVDIDSRVNDLLGRMTIEEKVAQLGSISAPNLDKRGRIINSGSFRDGVGQLSRTGEDLFPKETVRLVNALQHFLVDSTRLGIRDSGTFRYA